MSYVDDVLEPGEHVLRVARPHWVAFIPPAAMMGGTLGAALVLLGHPQPFVVWWGLAVLFLAGLLRFLSLQATEFVITDRRVILKTGFLTRHSSEINNAKVESVDVDQGLLGRLLGFGTVKVHGTGEGVAPFRTVADPLGFRQAIMSLPG
jgi:uncharacterized membrane protein YdbT with pleckstrin-like domain